jgi:hypothetical protein
MGLADIAAGIETTTEQRETGVASVDRTEGTLAERIAALEADLPCDPEAAATLLEAYTEGRSVGDAGAAAGLATVTAAKTLHLFGEQVDPLAPHAREVVRDWLDGRLPRREALTLAGVGEREFALGAYVLTHDPIPAAREAAEGTLVEHDATGERLAALGEASSDVGDLIE